MLRFQQSFQILYRFEFTDINIIIYIYIYMNINLYTNNKSCFYFDTPLNGKLLNRD